MKRRIVLLGPPASGKGTQAELIEELHEIPTASTGAMMREEQARCTPLGSEMARWTSEGKLFPDSVALQVLTNWLECGNWDAFVLDGFPRTIGQAQAFGSLLSDRGGSLDLAISLTLPLDEIRDRVLNRVTCVRCGATYGMTFHRVKPGDPCVDCGARLERRSDDTLETLDARLAEHERHTGPVIQFYRDAGLLVEIDAMGGRDVVAAEIAAAMDGECRS
ncbi:MAG: nucleoside monophosphate kinase [Chthoniobacterales bacterium]